jgi:hypothetical protein
VNPEKATAQARGKASYEDFGKSTFVSTTAQVIECITQLADAGADHTITSFSRVVYDQSMLNGCVFQGSITYRPNPTTKLDDPFLPEANDFFSVQPKHLAQDLVSILSKGGRRSANRKRISGKSRCGA